MRTAEKLEYDPNGDKLNPSREQVLSVAVIALARAYERHMGVREQGAWEPLSLILERHYGVDSANELWTPSGSGQAIVVASELPKEMTAPAPPDLRDEGRSISVVGQSTLFINGLTEDNQPHYTSLIDTVFGGFEETVLWNGVWTSEEQRHALSFAYYSALSGWMNSVELETARRAQVQGGKIPRISTPEDAFIYTTVQEAATQVSHRNGSGHLADRSIFKPVMGKMASEEGDHFRVYCEAARAVRYSFPDRFLTAFKDQLLGFQMPGAGIEGFRRHAVILSQAGVLDIVDIYNIWNQMYQEWDLQEIEPQFSESALAKEVIEQNLAGMKEEALQVESKRVAIRNGLRAPYEIRSPLSVGGEKVVIPPPPRAKTVGVYLVRAAK